MHNIRKLTFSVPLPDFKQNWMTLLGKKIIFPRNSTSVFLKLYKTSENAPSLNYVSDKNLLSPFPPSLFKALETSKTYRQVWLDSYNEEK